MRTALKRDRDISVNLEAPVHRITVELAERMGISASSFIRQLLIDELRDRGLLTDRQLADMVAAAS